MVVHSTRMNSAATTSSVTFNKSRIPTPQGNGVRKEIPSSGTTKMAFDKGKNAVELKQRLASAVSAKIAAAREGRTAINGNNNNRGIGYLLQRKHEQHDSKLNTKAISFQKPIRNNNGGKARNSDGIEAKSGSNLRSGTNDLSKLSQKSLLSALMSSRVASGITTKQSGMTAKQSGIPRPDRTPAPKPSTRAGRPTMAGNGNQTINPDKSFRNGTTTTVDDKKDSTTLSSSIQKKKVEEPLFAAKPAVSTRGNDELDKANGIANRNASLSVNYSKKNASLPPKTTPNSSMSIDNIVSKNLDVNPNVNDSHISKTNALLTTATSPKKQHLLENEHRGNIDTDATSKENSSLTLTKNEVVPGKASSVSKRDDKFREDLLEKLEADVGNCKIVTFQNMEDFSVLRMRIYRIRGDLEQLKKTRERRTAV